MTAETWTIVGTAIVILLAIVTSSRGLRSEIRDLRIGTHRLENRMDELETKLTERINAVETKLTERINAVETKLTERINAVETKLTAHINAVETKLTERMNRMETALSERLGRAEGMLEVIRDSIFDRSTARKKPAG